MKKSPAPAVYCNYTGTGLRDQAVARPDAEAIEREYVRAAVRRRQQTLDTDSAIQHYRAALEVSRLCPAQ
jgi:hypothetical protein